MFDIEDGFAIVEPNSVGHRLIRAIGDFFIITKLSGNLVALKSQFNAGPAEFVRESDLIAACNLAGVQIPTNGLNNLEMTGIVCRRFNVYTNVVRDQKLIKIGENFNNIKEILDSGEEAWIPI